jgi:formate hydrogenlyase transcriptional activator
LTRIHVKATFGRLLSHDAILELETDPISVSSCAALHDTASEVVDAAQPTEAAPSLRTLEEVERDHVFAVLHQARWVIEGSSGAAKTLGMHPNTLRHRMQKLGIKRSAHRIS